MNFLQIIKNPNSPQVYGLLDNGQWIAFNSMDQVPQGAQIQIVDQTPTQVYGYNDYFGQQKPQSSLTEITEKTLDALAEKGLTINPDVEVTPEKLAEFLKFAESEVDPGYKAQLKVARESLLRNLGHDTESIQRFEADQERKYGQDIRKLGENLAEQGFAQSGRRLEGERDLAFETQRTLDDKKRELGFAAGSEAINFIQNQGSRNLPESPMLDETRVLPGQANFQRTPGVQRPYYSLSPDLMDNIVGEQEKSRATGIRSLAQEYEGLYRQGRTIPNPRELTI